MPIYLWGRANDGYIALLWIGLENANIVENRYHRWLRRSGEVVGAPANFNRRHMTREWFLIRQGEMNTLLVALRDATNRNVGEITGTVVVNRAGRLVAAVRVPETAMQQYIERGYITIDFLIELLRQNVYMLCSRNSNRG
jgi:hypothetical protein